MRYTNPVIPEGINVSEEHPLKEFASLTIGITLLVVVGVTALSWTAGYFSRFIPFELEQKMVGQLPAEMLTHDDANNQQIETYLQTLANQLATHQGLDEHMPVTVHYVEDETVNAGATLGGHIIMFKGLLEKLPHENALAMVMAHEIAHIKHRDPILALGRGITVALALASIAGASDSGLLDGVINQTGMLTLLTFNRDQEQQADLEALQTLESYYGHTRGAAALFETLKLEEEDSFHQPEFLSSHPLTNKRIDTTFEYTATHGNKINQKLSQLPDFIKNLANQMDSSDNKTAQEQ